MYRAGSGIVVSNSLQREKWYWFTRLFNLLGIYSCSHIIWCVC